MLSSDARHSLGSGIIQLGEMPSTADCRTSNVTSFLSRLQRQVSMSRRERLLEGSRRRELRVSTCRLDDPNYDAYDQDPSSLTNRIYMICESI